MTSAGHDVRLFCPTSNLPPSEKRTVTHGGINITRFGTHKRVDDTLVDWFELVVQEHKREPFDLLHAYFVTQAGFIATYTGKYLNLPSVVSIRGNDVERAPFDPSRFSHVMYTLQHASALTTNAMELIKKTQVFVNREIVLIPNGIDSSLFKSMERNNALAEALGVNAEDRVIGFVGELREKKGLNMLLKAYSHVHEAQSTTLLIVGNIRAGEDQQRFDDLKSSIPDSRIIVTGYVSNHDLPSYYSVVDVFVHPSLRDGLPNSLLEAMACEKPVIATPVGGMVDVLRDRENGRYTPMNDVNSLATIIQELLSDKDMREHLGRSARQSIQSDYTLKNELNGNLKIYRDLGFNV